MIRVSNEELQISEREKALYKISCLSPIWLISAVFEFISVLIFYAFVKKIDQNTQEEIQEDRSLGYDEERHLFLY